MSKHRDLSIYRVYLEGKHTNLQIAEIHGCHYNTVTRAIARVESGIYPEYPLKPHMPKQQQPRYVSLFEGLSHPSHRKYW